MNNIVSRLLSGDTTVNLDNGVTMTHGYVVGGKTEGLVFLNEPDAGAAGTVSAWLDGKTGVVGSWTSPEGILFIDNDDVFNDFDRAMEVARERKELAIYSIHDDTVHETGITVIDKYHL